MTCVEQDDGSDMTGQDWLSCVLVGRVIGLGRLAVRATCPLLICAAAMLAACATPAQRMNDIAVHLGYSRAVVRGTNFSEVAYYNSVRASGGELHVYLEGDGLPWVRRFRVARDPTPRRPLMLRLMALDQTPSVYLARPCYQGYAQDPPCTPWMWTQGRYSTRVVDSMAAALRKVMAGGRYDGLVFLGYSGGGTLAMLLAERFPQTRAVITVAGNLDPDAWTAYHGYTPLTGSLNPARRPPLSLSVVQLHLAGSKDSDVPPGLIRAAAAREDNARVMVMRGFDHVCCWARIWPGLLRGLSKGRPWAYLSGKH